MKRGFMGKNGVHEEYVGEDYKDDKEYVYDDDTCDEDDVDDEESEDDEDEGHDCRWVGDNDRFDVFVYWLSGNECSDEDRKEITNSFDLLCGCFTAEKLLTDVRKSDLFSIKDIADHVLEIMSFARREMIIDKNGDLAKKEYSGMLLEDFKVLPDYA